MILITGAKGQLGTELQTRIPDAIATDYKELDITNLVAVSSFVHRNKIDTIINCAAYTAVDRAEGDKAHAYKLNALGPEYLAKTGANMVHISTDYVFDGAANRPYTPDDVANPMSVYGATKKQGELGVIKHAPNAVIIRTAWLYSPYGGNFVKTMRELGAQRDSINVVCDQIGTPTYAGDLADAIVKIIPQMNKDNGGIYHFSNEGVCSWYDFATQIMDMSGLKCRVNPITSDKYPTRAVRPAYSVLDKSKIKQTFGLEIDHWTKGLEKCIAKMNSEKQY